MRYHLLSSITFIRVCHTGEHTACYMWCEAALDAQEHVSAMMTVANHLVLALTNAYRKQITETGRSGCLCICVYHEVYSLPNFFVSYTRSAYLALPVFAILLILQATVYG